MKRFSCSFTSFTAQKFQTQKTFPNFHKWCPEWLLLANLIKKISDWLGEVMNNTCSEKILKISCKTNASDINFPDCCFKQL